MNPNNTLVKQALLTNNSWFKIPTTLFNKDKKIDLPTWDEASIDYKRASFYSDIRPEKPIVGSKLILFVRCLGKYPFYLIVLKESDGELILPVVKSDTWESLNYEVDASVYDVIGGFHLQGQINKKGIQYIIYESCGICFSPRILKDINTEVATSAEIIDSKHVAGKRVSSEVTELFTDLDLHVVDNEGKTFENPHVYFSDKKGIEIPNKFNSFNDVGIGYCERWLLFLGSIGYIKTESEVNDTLVVLEDGKVTLFNTDRSNKLLLGSYFHRL